MEAGVVRVDIILSMMLQQEKPRQTVEWSTGACCLRGSFGAWVS